MSFPGNIEYPPERLDTLFKHSLLPLDGRRSIDAVTVPMVAYDCIYRPSLHGCDPIYTLGAEIGIEHHQESLVRIDLRFKGGIREYIGLPVIGSIDGVAQYTFGDPESVVGGIAGIRLYVHGDGRALFTCDRLRYGRSIVTGTQPWEAVAFATRCLSAVGISRSRRAENEHVAQPAA
jgi:hypothetical protein